MNNPPTEELRSCRSGSESPSGSRSAPSPHLLAVSVFGTTGVGKARRLRKQLIEDAEREAEAVRREAQIESREQAVDAPR